MRSSMRACAIVACVALSFLRGAPFSPAATPVVESSSAKLVRAALESELAGSPEDRARLLAEALAIDPNFAPARWQSGFVRIGNEWVQLDDVPKRVAGDPQLAAYRKMRDAVIDTADHHRELARWCHKNRLLDLERVHWAKVLEFDQRDAEALEALGLKLYEGRLMTAAQIEREKVAAGQRQRALRQWQPQLTKWRQAIERGNEEDRTTALESLKALDDPAAIPALEAALVGDGKRAYNDSVSQALVDAVGRMPTPAATQSLLKLAVWSEPQDLRNLATDELKKRPMHAYVPQLIAALPGSLKTRFNIFLLPDGMVVHEHEMLVAGRQANWSLSYESTVNPADRAMASFVAPRAVARELLRANQIESQAQAAEKQLSFVRDRVQAALVRATGFTRVDEPELWEKQYNDYNGWYAPDHEKPTYTYANTQYESYTTPPVDYLRIYSRRPRVSCFPSGTRIATITGPEPIERIKVGDLVLSQDTASGELAYKPVQGTTLRPPVALTEIRLENESILATPGHPFWVIGEGWRMARQLKPGWRLHTVVGTQEVIGVETAREREAYNLVVSDLHTYFVGDSKLLVHDNAPLEERPQLVPGLASTKP